MLRSFEALRYSDQEVLGLASISNCRFHVSFPFAYLAVGLEPIGAVAHSQGPRCFCDDIADRLRNLVLGAVAMAAATEFCVAAMEESIVCGTDHSIAFDSWHDPRVVGGRNAARFDVFKH